MRSTLPGLNDGTKGISLIKRAGGMVMIQHPETCLNPIWQEAQLKQDMQITYYLSDYMF